jgi:hypothetical protein
MSQRDGFGKRGRVELRQREPELPQEDKPSGIGGLGWVGGAIAAVALAALIGSGGGSGLVSGLIGGLIGHQFAKSLFGGGKTTTASSPARPAAISRAVKRSGFGGIAARISARSSGS